MRIPLSILLPVLLLSACQATGPEDNPVLRSFKWFSYLGGDDLRAACAKGAPAQYRFVYNGIWTEQVRTYDIVSTGYGHRQESRVLGQGNVAMIDLRDPIGPWRGPRVDTALTHQDVQAIEMAFERSLTVKTAPAGSFLRSDDYYWTASECRDGQFRFAAWTTHEADLNMLPFVAPLLGRDLTEVPLRAAKTQALGPFRRYDPMSQHEQFEVQVGENGLRIGGRIRG